MKNSKLVFTLVSVIMIIVCLINAAITFNPPTILPSITLSLTSTIPAVTNTQEPASTDTSNVTNSDMLDLYKQILDVVKWAFQVSLVIMPALLSVGGIGALWMLQRSLQGVWDAHAKAKEIEAEFNLYTIRYKELSDARSELARKLESTETSLEKSIEELKFLKLQTKTALSDISRIQYLETIASVQIFAMQLFRGTTKDFEIAKRKLVELSKDDNAIVRRECIRVFSSLSEYPEHYDNLQDSEILKQLMYLAKNDSESGVRLEAQKAVSELQGLTQIDTNLISNKEPAKKINTTKPRRKSNLK